MVYAGDWTGVLILEALSHNPCGRCQLLGIKQQPKKRLSRKDAHLSDKLSTDEMKPEE